MQCKECGRKPSEIQEYIEAAKEYECTPEEFVWREEGTYNGLTGKFWCTECYVKLGMPLGKA
jgi:hypothetical protein